MDKTKEQFIKELEALRWRVAELEKLEAERERAVEALRESEERLKIIVENTDDVIFQLSPLGIIQYVSPKVEEIYGYKPEDLIGKHLKKTTPASELSKASKVLKSVLLGKAISNFEINQMDGNGKIIPMEINGTPVKKDGKIIAVQGVMRDITERKRAEEALRKSEASLAEAQRIAHLGNWDWDIVKNELIWSDEIYRIFGLTPQKFGASYEAFLNSVHPDDREFVKKCVDEALYERKPYSIDHRIVLPDGSERVVHEQAEVTFDEVGKPVRMVGTVQDITELKRAAEALQQSEENLRLTLESVTDGITVSDLGGNILLMNEAAVYMHGYDSKEELTGRSAFELMAEEDHARAVENLKRTLEDGYVKNIEYTFLKRDGGKFPAELSAAVLRDTLGTPIGFVATAKDITERKGVEEQLVVNSSADVYRWTC